MNLNEFYDYKNQLMKDILTDEEIVDLITSGLETPNVTDIAYKYVFPYEYIPDTVQQGATYVCFDVDILRSPEAEGLIYIPIIYIWIFSHRSVLRLPEGGVRPDKLCAKICERINGSYFYGQGKLELYSAKRFAPMTDHQGKSLVFHAKDFKKVYNPKQVIPSNRKLGV